ncbi:ankyrin [Cordyceps fumosorosea ARSEF 2679]|uniref:Ankyrin n=1 Tax=Cordyceps fumosorosea (strain ARSEF 2679) TaxID=1081104 RepID=A0A168APD2_CORFA|nr:ankyrin [Cordyceps fumosorosea ARSEF 2679]OAA69011.1 ankyrin [Cordyceps fumosorosea ARSEF 2679]
MEPKSNDAFLQDDAGRTIAEHAEQCREAFDKYMAIPQTSYDPTIMEDQRARFVCWEADMDEFRTSDAWFYYQLRLNLRVVKRIHRHLDFILSTLTRLNLINESAETATAKKRRLLESGRAEATKTVEYSSNADTGGYQGESDVYLITCTIYGTVTLLRRCFNQVRRSAEIARAGENGHVYIWECRAPSHKLITFQHESEYRKHIHTEHNIPMSRITESKLGSYTMPPKKETCFLALQEISCDGDDSTEGKDSNLLPRDDGPYLVEEADDEVSGKD